MEFKIGESMNKDKKKKLNIPDEIEIHMDFQVW